MLVRLTPFSPELYSNKRDWKRFHNLISVHFNEEGGNPPNSLPLQICRVLLLAVGRADSMI